MRARLCNLRYRYTSNQVFSKGFELGARGETPLGHWCGEDTVFILFYLMGQDAFSQAAPPKHSAKLWSYV